MEANLQREQYHATDNIWNTSQRDDGGAEGP